jgi:hypothetical protein
MIIFDEDRPSDSPFVERIWRCHSEGTDPFRSIAASRCELVVSRLEGKVTMTVRGPETRATPQGDCPGDGEWLGILLKLGTFLPHLPTSTLVDTGVDQPTASRNTFWLSPSNRTRPLRYASLTGGRLHSGHRRASRLFRSAASDPLALVPYRTNTSPDP